MPLRKQPTRNRGLGCKGQHMEGRVKSRSSCHEEETGQGQPCRRVETGRITKLSYPHGFHIRVGEGNANCEPPREASLA
jgi:hypothetical protein